MDSGRRKWSANPTRGRGYFYAPPEDPPPTTLGVLKYVLKLTQISKFHLKYIN